MLLERIKKNKAELVVVAACCILIFLIVVTVSQFIQPSPPEPPAEPGEESPLVNILPTTSVTAPYTIEYVTTKDGVEYISVSDSTPVGREKALAWLRAQGYNPTNMEIAFYDYVNPLVPTEGGE